MKTHVYLGLINSGKGQAMYYARTKKKTIAKWKKRHIVKIIHDSTFQIKEKLFERKIHHTLTRDNDVDSIQREEKDSIYNEPKDNENWIWQEHKMEAGFMNPNSIWKGRPKGRDDTVHPNQQVIKKIDPSYMHDVDLLLLRDFSVITHNIVLFQSTINVIPYKTNLVDSARSKLDKFGTHRAEEYGNKLLDVYNKDKNRVWDFLDCYLKDIDDTIMLCKSNNIPYVMFNLDEDNYEDTFGWGELQYRDLTNHNRIWQRGDRYDILDNMAKEYVSQLSTEKFYHLTDV